MTSLVFHAFTSFTDCSVNTALGRDNTASFTRRANSTRRAARVHNASTASGSSGTLRPHREVFSVDANGMRRVCCPELRSVSDTALNSSLRKKKRKYSQYFVTESC